jgi:predicted MFS family arabinose efflux permease
MAVSGGGSMIVALLLPRWLTHLKVKQALFIGAAILVSGLFFAATGPGWISFLATWFALGVGMSFIQVPAGSLVRMSCHPDDTVALFAANFSLSHLCWLFAYPLSGIIGAEFGLQTAFAVMGGIALAAALASWRYYPTPDKIELEHIHEVQAHTHLNGHDSRHDLVEEPVDQSGSGSHTHEQITHTHKFVIDLHHPRWP